MDDLTSKKIEQSRDDRRTSHDKMLEKSDSYKHLLEVERSAFSAGTLSAKAKELIALAISIVTKCEPCMEWHAEQAVRAGATEKEIYETIDVALEMGGGPAAAYARFAIRSYEYYRSRTQSG